MSNFHVKNIFLSGFTQGVGPPRSMIRQKYPGADRVKQQISGTVIVTKCARTYACIFMEEFERNFLQTQDH